MKKIYSSYVVSDGLCINTLNIAEEKYLLFPKAQEQRTQKHQSYFTSYQDIYEHKLCINSPWSEIENWIVSSLGNEDISFLLSILEQSKDISKEHRKAFSILNELINYNFLNNSFINFVRYLPIIVEYITSDNYNIASVNNIIRLHLWNDSIHLVLNFREDFIIDYFSYDNEEASFKEKLTYSMKGTFSSSSTLRKSYKLERLMSIFDRHHCPEHSILQPYVFYKNGKKRELKVSSHDIDKRVD